MSTNKEVQLEADNRHRNIVANGYTIVCTYCACKLDGSIYHNCKEGKVKHLCLDLTRPRKGDE